MEWKMEVYSPDLELLGILEEYDSVMFEQFAFKPGSFSLQTNLSQHTRSLLKPENIVWLGEDIAGIVEYVQASVSDDGYTLSIKGSLLDGILSRRVLWGLYNMYGSPPAIMQEVVNDCAISPTKGNVIQRIIPNLILSGDPPEDARRIRKQSTGDVLTDFLSEVGQANRIAHGVRFNAAVPRMEFWTRIGANRTVNQTDVDPVLYSTELDDVLSSEYSYDSSNYRNIALVAGEGEGNNRKTEMVMEEPKSKLLPDGYTQLEYIESTGDQFLDTGVLVSKDTTVELDMKIDSTTAWSTLLGSQYSQDSVQWNFLVQYVSATQIKAQYFEGQGPYITSIPDLMERNVLKLGKNGYSFGNKAGALNPSTKNIVSANSIYLFAQNVNGKPASWSKFKMYSFTVYEGNAITNYFVPCKNDAGKIGAYDVIKKEFHPGGGSSDIVAGPVVSFIQEPSGISRIEMYVDARDLQSDADPDAPMSEEEYLEALKTRGKEGLSDCQLVQSFSATVRTMDPTYIYGIDFFLGDTITVTDERLGISVDAIIEGIERSIGKNGEDLVFTLGYSLPTISDRLRKAGV